MSRLARLTGVLAVTAWSAIGVGGGVAVAAGPPIGSSQHFVGVVNGQEGQAVVYTVCPGPEKPGQMGPLEGGQTFEVVEAPNGAGYTGPFNGVNAWFVPKANGAKPVQVHFTKYGQTKAIPSSVRVPCSGRGQVEFSSCPYLAPCAAGWVPDYVRVTFEDIAV